MNTIVETQALTKIYGQVRALSDVTLSIPAGATGLLGPNGAGKSTLIRALIGLVRPTSGDGRLYGMDITKEGLEIRGRIGYMPEHECLIGDMKAIQMVAYAGLIAGMPRSDAMQRAHEVLHFVGIGDERYRTIDSYSTGMKQKVNLAQALVHDPDLLLLDEPTNGLDPKGREEMLDLIRFLAHEKGKSVILSSHILPDVEHVCANIIVLSRGEVRMQGNLKEQLRGEGDVVNIRVQGNRPAFDLRMREAGYNVQEHEAQMTRISVLSGDIETKRVFADIMRCASETQCQIRYASRSAMNLEDLFITIVEKDGIDPAHQTPRKSGNGGVIR